MNSILNSLNNDGDTPIHAGLKKNCSFYLLARLVLAGSNVDIRNKKGRTQLHEAAKCSRIGLHGIELLIAAGAPKNAIDDEGSSVLHDALKNPIVELPVIKSLLEHSVYPDFRDMQGFPPLAYVESSSLSADDRKIAAELLIKYTVSYKFKDSDFIELNLDEILEKRNQILSLDFCADQNKHRVYEEYRDSCIKEMDKLKDVTFNTETTLFESVIEYCVSDSYVDSEDLENSKIVIDTNCVCYRDILYSACRFS